MRPRRFHHPVRRRRLLFVAAMFPGALMAVAGAQLTTSPPLILAGLAWLAIGAVIGRRLAPSWATIPADPPTATSIDPEPAP